MYSESYYREMLEKLAKLENLTLLVYSSRVSVYDSTDYLVFYRTAEEFEGGVVTFENFLNALLNSPIFEERYSNIESISITYDAVNNGMIGGKWTEAKDIDGEYYLKFKCKTKHYITSGGCIEPLKPPEVI